MIELTVQEVQDRIDEIIDDYDNGSDQLYLIKSDKGNVVMKPYDGPWTETIVKDGDDYLLPLPQRIINKFNLKEGDDLKLEVVGDSIIINFE